MSQDFDNLLNVMAQIEKRMDDKLGQVLVAAAALGALSAYDVPPRFLRFKVGAEKLEAMYQRLTVTSEFNADTREWTITIEEKPDASQGHTSSQAPEQQGAT